MSCVISLRDLKDTTLWKKLHDASNEKKDSDSAFLTANLPKICEEASDRMKGMPSLHGQYTLHDETHLLRVTELMAKIIPEKVLNKLNSIEIALLILSAYFHDQGMVLDKNELETIKSKPKYIVFRDTWAIEHPNLKEIQIILLDKGLSAQEKDRFRQMEQELFDGMLTDYIRQSHAHRSANFIRSNYSNDSLWEVAGVNLAIYVAKICESHVLPASDLIPEKGFNYDESIGQYKINLSYLSLVLRLADILDFDRDRTPDSLYKTIHFTNNISLTEWEKHRSVEGWDISPSSIRFTMLCEKPQYHKAALDFMDLVDNELKAAINLIKSYPKDFENYDFELPISVNRDRIKAKDNAYLYHDLEFSLSRNDIVKLLMTDKLYSSPSLCVRELLQNSLDALRYRRALRKLDGSEWSNGKVILKHTVDKYGYEVLSCIDNGVGMDEEVITRFLTRVGKSFYRSPEFEQERIRFSELGVDFDPCSRFGIGFMSCFMIGDQIKIHTRRDYGPSKGWGDPIIVEINGLGSMVVIKKGSPDQQPGTTIEVRGRKKPRFFDEYEDNINLIEVIDSYAVACEFPMEAHCEIDEIRNDISISPGIEKFKTEIEEAKISNVITFEQDFSEIDPNLRGYIRASFLVDDKDMPTLSNSEAYYLGSEIIGNHNPLLLLRTESNPETYKKIETDNWNSLCQDGILICGKHGQRSNHLGKIGIWSNNHIPLGEDCFILDVRGNLKPALTPARDPPDSWRQGSDWKRLRKLANQAHGRLWEKVAQLIGPTFNNQTFWALALIHRAPVPWMRTKVAWSKLSVPIVENEELIEWRRLDSLERVIPQGYIISNKSGTNRFFRLLTKDSMEITASKELKQWEHPGYYNGNLVQQLHELIISMSTMSMLGGSPCISIQEPRHDETRADYAMGSIFMLPYIGELSNAFTVQLPVNSVNFNHPLAKLALEAKYLEAPSDIQKFACSAVYTLGDSLILESINDSSKCNDPWINRRLRHLGSLYLSIDWDKYLQNFSPPYEIWHKEIGLTQITDEHFGQWASLTRIKE